MREILFRGKSVIGGQWLNGDLIHTTTGKAPMIRTHGKNSAISHMVDPDTVGQYTGLTDKNGKWIFEGDIFLHNNKYLYEVAWCDERKVFCAIGAGFSDDDFLGNFYECNIEVIGNIHDNPELIAEVEG